MHSGGAHNSHRFGTQFLHFCSVRQGYFPPSKKCSLIQTKNKKIRSCWPQLCGLFGITETRFEPHLRIIRSCRRHQHRFKRWQTFNRLIPLMHRKTEALFNPRFDGHHLQMEKLKLILMELNSEIWAKQVWESLSETAKDKHLLLCLCKQVFHSLQK